MKERFCVKCGKKFFAIGRQVICPDCKAAAEEESKKAAVMRAKKASWAGESVPVRISGRASTVIRKYGAAHDVPFAEALDELLKSTDYFKSVGMKWEEVEPYRSHRRDKHTTESAGATETAQEAQEAQEVKQATSKPVKPVKPVKQAAKAASKASASKATSKANKK